MKRVLLVHGWGHTSDILKPLGDLLNAEVEYMLFPGMDCDLCKPIEGKVMDYYTSIVFSKIRDGNYDCVVAHSMGAIPVLKAASELQNPPKIVLLSPVYGAPKRLVFLIPFKPIWTFCIRCVQKTPILEYLSRFTVFDKSSVDNRLLNCTRSCNPEILADTLWSILTERWRVPDDSRIKNVCIVTGDSDILLGSGCCHRLANDIDVESLWVLQRSSHCVFLDHKMCVASIINSYL